jgi:hypothetical protein
VPTTYTGNYGGKDQTFNIADVDNVYKQIVGQGLMSKWTGQGFGSAEANAKEMAKNLVASGVTDISQVGQKTVTDADEERQNEDGSYTTVPGQTRTVIINKATGEPLLSDYAERTKGNLWSGTFIGGGNTGYGVQFDTKGNPYFFTQGASSNDVAAFMQDVGPLGQIALAVATGGLSIPEQIAANLAIQVLSGKDIGDAIKSAALS